MGCLNLQVDNRTVCDVSFSINGQNHPLNLDVDSKNTKINPTSTVTNKPVSVNALNKNIDIDINTFIQKIELQLVIGLVCQVSLGKFEAFYVQQGPFMIEQGYFAVGKREGLTL